MSKMKCGSPAPLILAVWGYLSSHLASAQVVLDPLPILSPVRVRSYIYSAGPPHRNLTDDHPSGIVPRRRPTRSALIDYTEIEGYQPPEPPISDEQQQAISRNVSRILDGLFLGYNKTFRPGIQYGPTSVKFSLVVISLGPISELNSDYSMDCYFRQYWRDERLQFNGPENLTDIALNNRMLDSIWKPDTYFRNGKEYYVHTLTTTNKLLRLSPNGDILYSMRLTIRAQCPMKLTFYPADMQSCPLIIGSFAYEAHDILYSWHHEHGVKAENVTLSQFRLESFRFSNFSSIFKRGARRENYTMVRVDFKLQRMMGYFLLQIYLPCMLIVVLSWVSFWLNREATERLTLGITAFLTLATTNQDQKDILPKTSFPTALEWYILICNTYVSASIIQFAAVHFFTKTGFEELVTVGADAADCDTDDDWENIPKFDFKSVGFDKVVNNHDRSRSSTHANHNNHRDSKYKINDDPVEFTKETGCQKLIYCLTGNERYRAELIRRGKYRESTLNSVSMLDRVSRLLFPLSFVVVNVFYWTAFLYADPPKITDIGDEWMYHGSQEMIVPV